MLHHSKREKVFTLQTHLDAETSVLLVIPNASSLYEKMLPLPAVPQQQQVGIQYEEELRILPFSRSLYS